MKALLTFSFTLVLSLLGSQAMAADKAATADENANLVIYRLQEPAKTKGVYYRLSVNGESVGKLKSASAIRLSLAPGEHVITAQDKKRSSLTVTVAEGETTYVAGNVNRKRAMELAITTPESDTQAAIAGL